MKANFKFSQNSGTVRRFGINTKRRKPMLLAVPSHVHVLTAMAPKPVTAIKSSRPRLLARITRNLGRFLCWLDRQMTCANQIDAEVQRKRLEHYSKCGQNLRSWL